MIYSEENLGNRKIIFPSIDYRIDPEYKAKASFNAMYEDGYFIECIDGIVIRGTVVVNGLRCMFPDFEIGEPASHFEGVKFALYDNQIIISEAACSALVDQACARYAQLQPENSAKISDILQARLL